MTQEEKLEIIADILEEDIEHVTEDSVLDEFETWDSVAVLSVISVVSEHTGRFLHADEIKNMNTVKDLLKLLG